MYIVIYTYIYNSYRPIVNISTYNYEMFKNTMQYYFDNK